MSNKKNVRIRITSVAGQESIIQEASGELYIREGKVYVLYQETSEEMGSTSTMVKAGPEELKITRKGQVGSEQTFVAGHSRTGWYRMPEGSIPMETRTRTYVRNLQDGIGVIDWSYDLYVGEEHAGLYTLSLTIQEDVR
ncbi:DUF1934 domain-containing protein [Paenibacillus chitinolyticus]